MKLKIYKLHLKNTGGIGPRAHAVVVTKNSSIEEIRKLFHPSWGKYDIISSELIGSAHPSITVPQVISFNVSFDISA